MKAHFAVPEIVDMLSVSEDLIAALEQENLIFPTMRDRAKLFPRRDIERIGVANALISYLGANLAGIEVALHMRSQIILMAQKIDEFSPDVTRARPASTPLLSKRHGLFHRTAPP